MNICRLISPRTALLLAGVAVSSTTVPTADANQDHVVSVDVVEPPKSKQGYEKHNPLLKNDPFPKNQHQQKNTQHAAVAAGAVNNPAVIVGLGLTCLALIGMMRKSYTGDRIGAQRYMQYRIYAQFFTIFAIIAGVGYYSHKLQKQAEKDKKEQENAEKTK